MMRSTTSSLLATAVCLLVLGCPVDRPPDDPPGDQVATWKQTYYDIGRASDMVSTPDEGFAVTTDSGLLKLNVWGQQEWLSEGGKGDAVTVARQGGYVVCGPSTPSQSDQAWVRKLSANGGEQWAYLFGNDSTVACSDVCQTADGGYAVVGTYAPMLPEKAYDLHGRDVVLLKLSSTGQAEWIQVLDVLGGESSGTRGDLGYAVIEDRDGGYVVVGYTMRENSLVNADGFLVKTDSAGAPQLVIHPIGSFLNNVYLTPGGDYVVGGSIKSAATGYDLYLAKLNRSGGIYWEQTYGGALLDLGAEFQTTPDGGYIVVGQTAIATGSGDSEEFIYLVKTNGNGIQQWSRTYGADGQTHTLGKAVCTTPDGGFAALGDGFFWDNGDQRIVTFVHLVKTNAMGELN